MTKDKLKKINNILAGLIIAIALYLILAPFLPQLKLILDKLLDQTDGYQYQSQLAEKEGIPSSQLNPVPEENTLVIPSIGVNAVIHEGPDINTLLKGPWRRPLSSSPDKGGNTVITGHRFQYTAGPNTFYHLDKLVEEDKIIVFWDQKEYDYEVSDIQIVAPDATEIENNTKEPILTLYTCTPLWTAKNRLVIIAKPINPN